VSVVRNISDPVTVSVTAVLALTSVTARPVLETLPSTGLLSASVRWAGADCSIETPYTGVCDAHCMYGCFGPSARECIECVENAQRDMYGNCVCGGGWTGEACNSPSSYAGRCFPTCKTCNGPYASDCIQCIDHAFKDMYGTCVCIETWTGLTCSYNLMSHGPCDPKCLGCTGPDSCDCLQCV
jgi:hypothetical protein